MKTSADAARSIRHLRVVMMISALFSVQACSNDRITAAPAITNGLVPGVFRVRVSGTVTNENGVPVAGVIVRLYRGTPNSRPVTTVTDATGFYSVSFLSAADMWAFTVKEGYRSAWQSREIAGRAVFRWDLRIYHT